MGLNIGIIVPANVDQRAQRLAPVVQAVLPTAACTTLRPHSSVKDYWVAKKNTKASKEIGPTGRAHFKAYMEKLAPRYDAFITYDLAVAHHVLPEQDTKGLTDADKVAGMLTTLAGKPLLFVADPFAMYNRAASDEEHAVAALITTLHTQKLKNHMNGVPTNTRPIKFIVPTSLADLRTVAEIAESATAIAYDIETSGGLISCIGFACELGLSHVPTIVIPLYSNIDGADPNPWANEITLDFALQTVGRILANNVPKITHNGSYDNTHILRYGWTVNNHVFDTMLMMHAMWPTLPRALYVGASIFLHGYRYWKDDAKDVGEDGRTKWQAPKTAEATYRYWFYNGQDCANTLELCGAILAHWYGHDKYRMPVAGHSFNYAWRTYVRKFAIEFGPAFYMSMNGLASSRERQQALGTKLEEKAAVKLAELRTLLGDPNFNPNSSAQVARLLYDEFGIKPLPRIGRTTDKRMLTKVADMHPIYATVIKAIADAKEPANNASKYANLPLLADCRFMAQFKAAVTTTARLSSAKHNLGVGTNLQNVPKPMRVVCFADPGRILDCADYAQSDSYGVAFESQDQTMIEMVLDDRDTHSVHVEFFFGVDYETVVKGNADQDPYIVHPITGLRQIIKKVTHGTNYDMGGNTMLLNVRRDAAIAMVRALLDSSRASLFMRFMGLDMSKPVDYYLANVALFSDTMLAKACDFAQGLYYQRYSRLKQWKLAAVSAAATNSGIIEMFGGSSTKMICNPHKNPRFVPAAYGQGFTSGNVNNAMLRLYFLADSMWADGFDMHLQVHDELITSFPEGKWDLVARKKAIMESPCTIHGRTFTVPVESELAMSWDPKNMVVWKGLGAKDYMQEIQACEAKTRKNLGLDQSLQNQLMALDSSKRS